MDYAAILTKQEIPMKEIIKELDQRGWHVISKEFQQFEETPSDVLVWMVFRWETLGYPNFPIKGYLRIIAKQDTNDMRAYFHIVQSPWYATIYYNVLHVILLIKERLRRKINRWLMNST